MVNFNWEFLLSIPQFCASTFHSGSGIRLPFAYGLACLVWDAVDEGAYAVECVQKQVVSGGQFPGLYS